MIKTGIQTEVLLTVNTKCLIRQCKQISDKKKEKLLYGLFVYTFIIFHWELKVQAMANVESQNKTLLLNLQIHQTV